MSLTPFTNAKTYVLAMTIALMFGITLAAYASPLEDGIAAYKNGDYVTAFKFWRSLADQGNADAQYDLSKMYFQGKGVAQDNVEAMKWLQLATNQGNAEAQGFLGIIYLLGKNGVTQDYAEAIKWLQLAANKGDVTAQYVLGGVYNEGKGVAQDYVEAVKWFRIAADQGNADAQYELSKMYFQGKGVAQDKVEAMKWLQLAANQGNAKYQITIGELYFEGKEFSQDYVEAMKWYLLAANQGNDFAQTQVGWMYYDGQGVAQDYVEAVKWFRLAAAQGNAIAQGTLGSMYSKGEGVAQDYVRSHMWFNLVASSSTGKMAKVSAINRDRIAMLMTYKEIAQAQAMTNTCRSSNYKQCGEPEGLPTTYVISSTPFDSLNRDDSTGSVIIPMQKQGGTLVVPVLINNSITLGFIVDSGSADVSIPADVVLTLMRTGTLKESDFLGEKVYVLADGTAVPSKTFRIRSMKVGDRVLESVTGSVAPVQGSLLLGQSFLGRFKSWSIDNNNKTLLLQ
jgi:TPR repeat protein